MWLKAEVIEGIVYLLSEYGDVWRVSYVAPLEPPTLRFITQINRDATIYLAEPSLFRFHRLA